MSSAPAEILLSDYQPPAFRTTDVELSFDIRDGETLVHSRLTVVREQPEASALVLDGEDLELLAVTVDGRVLSDNEYAVDAETLTIAGLSGDHVIEVETRIFPEQNTALEGLYRSRRMYCTQCEAQGFRKITYYQDRPDVLARFVTHITADAAYPTLLSNGNLIADESLADGRRKVSWQDPFPKPSYLFALVAGDLALLEDTFTTASGREIALQIFSEPHNIDQCHYAMDVLKRSMRWDEQRFGREYDLDIFMIVAVEDFNMGAMENKGLNIFNTSCVLASPDTATDAAYLRVEAVVAHEYFHNWSGNRVTCRDWFQLSLKEGFTVFRDAEFSSDMNSRPVKRIEDVAFLRSVQFAEDAGPLAHAVRPASYIEISNFYTTTIYEKGAEVVRMYHTLLGNQQFRQGTDLYFDRFDGQAVTTDDFAAVMEEVSGRDLSQFKRWYEQAGTPRISVAETYVDGTLTLTISQTCPATPRQPDKAPFHMPVLLGMLDASGAPTQLTAASIDSEMAFTVTPEGVLVELVEASSQLTISGFTTKPLVSFLRGFSAPVKVDYQRPDTELAMLVRHDVDGFVRWDALQTLWLAYFQGQLQAVDMVELVGDLATQCLSLETPEARQLAAMMLTVPDVNYLFEQMDVLDVDAVLDTRDNVLYALATAHQATWQALYQQLHVSTAYQPDAEGFARRALGQVAFAYLCRGLTGDALAQAITQHYEGADNLTDRRAALQVAINHKELDDNVRAHLLADFYNKWQNEALVVDLWFNLQAQSDNTDIAALQALTAHPSFDKKNPNRARSVYGAFGMLNHRRFHAPDGSGYQFLGQAIAELDALNPQLASRLATPLTRWRRYDAQRQSLMRDVLNKLAAGDALSKDLFEIVTKALADA